MSSSLPSMVLLGKGLLQLIGSGMSASCTMGLVVC